MLFNPNVLWGAGALAQLALWDPVLPGEGPFEVSLPIPISSNIVWGAGAVGQLALSGAVVLPGEAP